MSTLSHLDASPLNIVTSVPNLEVKPLTFEQKEELRQRSEQREFLNEIAKPSLQHSADARRRYDYEWMVRDLFRRGYQFSRYQPNTQTVVLASRQSAKIPINITRSQMRSIANQVTSFRPKFECMPRYTTEESSTQARYSGKLLDYYFDHLKFKKKIKETVMQGLMYSVGGPWQIVYDEGKKEINIWLVDPFDFYFDPLAEELEDAEYVIKAVRRPLGEIIYNSEYDKLARQEVRGGEARLAVSEYKQFMLQALKQVTQYNKTEAPTIILFEGYFRVREEGKEAHLKKVVWTDQNFTPLIYEDLDTNEYDFALYQADLNPKEILGEGWMKHVMPINRVINNLESSVFDYNYKVAKGRIVVDKDSGVRAIHNTHGEIISKNRGAEVRALDMPSLPIATTAQIERMYKYQEDISGVHDPCVDIETEILTLKGWKKFEEISKGEKVLSYNLKKDIIENDIINNLYSFKKQNEDLFRIKNKNIDALVTKNHRWPVLLDSSRKVLLKETKDLNTNDRFILSADYGFPTKASYSDDFVELVGWVITEGTYSQSPEDISRGKRKIRIIQSKKHDIECLLIENCLRRLGQYHKPYLTSDGCYQFYFANELARKLRELFPNKILTFDFINKLTEQQAHLLYKTLLLGDGTEIATKTVFYNTEIDNIDAFQYLCTLLGFNSRKIKYKNRALYKKSNFLRGKGFFKPFYGVSVKDQTKFTGFTSLKRKDKTLSLEKYTGVVWCPETKNGTFIARRNGFVFFTGNSLGRFPPGARSGVMLAEMKQSDSSSQQDLVDNLEDFLTEVARKMLRKISENYNTVKVVQDLGYKEEDAKYFAVVGKNYKSKKENPKNKFKIGPDYVDLAIIGDDNNVRVEIGSWLGYTKEMMQEKTIKLLQLGAIDQKTFLQLWEFGNVDNIVQKSRVEAMLKAQLSKPQGDIKQVDPYVENDMMVLEGKKVMPDPHDDHYVHIAVHQDALGRGNDELVGRHIQAHQIFMEQEKGIDNTMGQEQTAIGQGGQIPPQDTQRLQQIQGQQGGGQPPMPPPQTGGMGQIAPIGG